MTGIVLAGGKSGRMGTDKAFLRVAGRPIVERVIDVLGEAFGKVIIVTNSPSAYAGYNALVIKDAVDMPGPLTGVYSGLLASGDEYNFVAACDMPFLNIRLVKFMAGLAAGHDAVVPVIVGQFEPLHAVYRRTAAGLMGSHILNGVQRITAVFSGLSIRRVSEEEIARFDPGRRSFINLNTPQEYKEALCSDSGCRNL